MKASVCQIVLLESVPSLRLRNGDLSAYLPTVVKDLSGTPFPGNQIPVSQITPLAPGVLKYLFLLPNTAGPTAISNNFVRNFPTPITSNQVDIRLDEILPPSNPSSRVSFTYKRRLTQYPPCSTQGLDGSELAEPVIRPENDWSLICCSQLHH